MKNTDMATQGELPNIYQDAHAEMVDFRDQTRWNRLKGELAGFMAGSVLSVFVTGPHFVSYGPASID